MLSCYRMFHINTSKSRVPSRFKNLMFWQRKCITWIVSISEQRVITSLYNTDVLTDYYNWNSVYCVVWTESSHIIQFYVTLERDNKFVFHTVIIMKGKIHRQLHAFHIGKFLLVHYIEVKMSLKISAFSNNDITSES